MSSNELQPLVEAQAALIGILLNLAVEKGLVTPAELMARIEEHPLSQSGHPVSKWLLATAQSVVTEADA